MSCTLVWLYALLALLVWQAPLAAAQRDDNPTLCEADQSYNSTKVPYEFNNNAWGDDGSGQSCLQVNDRGESWSVSYTWTGNPELVKGFPRMKAHPSNLPVQFWNVSNLDFSAEWSTYVKGTENDSPEDQAAKFDDIYLRSNVALDVFLSDNATNSTLIGPPIEIMIWYWYTPTIKPLGYYEPTPDMRRLEVGGMNFSLYDGINARGQHVFSWLAERNMTSANADYAPLLRYIWQNGLLSGALWLGQLEFGFEIMHAGEETVSEVKQNYTLRILRDGDPDASTSSAKPTSTSPASSSSVSSSSTITEAATTSPQDAAATSSNAASMLTSPSADRGLLNLFGTWSFVLVLTVLFTHAHSFS